MSRHHTIAARLPDCDHTEQAHAAWRDARAAWIAEQPDRRTEMQYEHYAGEEGKGYPRPEYGPCEDCKAALWRASPWSPEVWAVVDAQAAAGHKSSPPIRGYRVPPIPKPRAEKAEKLYARVREALGRDRQKANDARTNAMIGTIVGPGTAGEWYRLVETNAAVALLEPAERDTDAGRPHSPQIAASSRAWVDLPADFQLALNRVKLFANGRSEAVTLEYQRGIVRISAQSPEAGEASESIDADGMSETLIAPHTTCLNAGYLDLACGIWPLRWYLAPQVKKSRPPDRYHPKGEQWTEHAPQHFEPGGDGGARVVIMPMRM